MDEPPQVQALPHYGGLPVPWIALWEAERVGRRSSWTTRATSTRPRSGATCAGSSILWCIAGPDNRTGAPDSARPTPAASASA